MIAPQLLVLTLYLTLAWGFYLGAAVLDYRAHRAQVDRRRGEGVRALRRVVVAFCLFMLPFSFFLRTGMVLAGVADISAAQIVFFALLGTNVSGSLFCIVSLRYD